MKRKWTPEQHKKFRATMKAKKSAGVAAPARASDVRAAIVFLKRAIKADRIDPLAMTSTQLQVQLALMALEGRL